LSITERGEGWATSSFFSMVTSLTTVSLGAEIAS